MVELRVRLRVVGPLVRTAALFAREAGRPILRASGNGSLASSRRPSGSRSRPATRQSAARVCSSGRMVTCWSAIGDPAGGWGSPLAASAARRPNTKHSASELEASRLAPWSPVHALSPTA